MAFHMPRVCGSALPSSLTRSDPSGLLRGGFDHGLIFTHQFSIVNGLSKKLYCPLLANSSIIGPTFSKSLQAIHQLDEMPRGARW